MGKVTNGKNERNTENLVRDALRDLDYYKPDNSISVEEQKSIIETIKKLLKGSSKSLGGGRGCPEFLVSNADTPDFLIIFECKASTADHESPSVGNILDGTALRETDEASAKRLQRYAVDGVLHYAAQLSKNFHVIAVAVSGETPKAAIISVYFHSRGAKTAKVLRSKTDRNPIKAILPWRDYLDHAVFDPAVREARLNDLMAFARELHDFMRDHAKLKLVAVSSIFDVQYGVNLELNSMKLDPNGINFVSRTARNNGVSAKVSAVPGLTPLPAGLLTVAGGRERIGNLCPTRAFL